MKTNNARFSHPVLVITSLLALLAASGALGALGACSAEFKTRCPEGTVQNGGGDVNDPNVCKALVGGAGGAGGAPVMGSAGAGGGILPVPPGGECNPNDTRCASDAQQTCGADGKWGESVGCEIACDATGKACVVPVQLALGTSHGCARMSDGTVRCWGSGEYGQLGNVSDQEQLTPQVVEGLGGVVDLVINASHTCARLSDDTLSCWGSNDAYSLQPTESDSVRFPNPMGVQGVKSASLLADNLCVLTGENTMICKGQDGRGGCGDGHESGHYVASKTFVTVQPPEPSSSLLQLFSGRSAHFVLAGDGSVYCWGVDKLAGIAYGVCPVSESVIDVGLVPKAFIVGAPSLLAEVAAASSVAVGEDFACAVHGDGKITCWGRNNLGQLGRGPTSASEGPASIFTLDSVKQAAIGAKHACAVTSDGRLFCWGSNSKGQLGAPCGLGLPCLPGSDDVPFVSEPALVRLSNVAEVRASDDYTCARTAESKVLCWGSNDLGQLGNGTKSIGELTPKPVVWK